MFCIFKSRVMTRTFDRTKSTTQTYYSYHVLMLVLSVVIIYHWPQVITYHLCLFLWLRKIIMICGENLI